MADVTSRLRLVVDSTGVDRAGRKLKDLRRNAKDADSAAAQLRRTFAGLAGVLGASISVRGLVQVADQYRQIENQLRLVTNGVNDLRHAQEGALRVANQTGASFETTARLYASLERFGGDFLKSQQEALDLTQAINQAALVSGASVVKSSNAIRQFTQAIAGGVLRAEEFNSIIENLPRLGQAIADGLGIGIGELRRQVNDGLVTTERFVGAVQSQFGTLADEAASASRTIGQAFEVLRNNAIFEIGGRLQGVQDIVVNAILAIGNNLETVVKLAEGLGVALALIAVPPALGLLATAFAAIISPLGLFIAGITTLVAFRDDIAKWAFGVDNAGALVRAAFEQIAPAIKAFVDAAKPFLLGFLDFVVHTFRFAVLAVQGAVNQFTEAHNKLQTQSLTNQYEQLAKRQRELVKDLQEVQNLTPLDSDYLSRSLGADAENAADVIRAQLDEVNDDIASVQKKLNGVLNNETDTGIFDEIIERAKELAAEGAKAGDDTAGGLRKIIDNAGGAEKAISDLGKEISRTNAKIAEGLIGDTLGRFSNIDFAALSGGQRSRLFDDFNRSVEDLDRILKDFADADLISGQQLQELRDGLNEAAVDFGMEAENGIRRGAMDMQRVFGSIIDDLIFGAATVGDIWREAIRFGVREAFIDPIAGFLSGSSDKGFFQGLAESFEKLIGKFADAGKSIASSISQSLAGAGKALGAALGGALAGFGLGQAGSDILGLGQGSTGRRTLTGAATGAGVGFAVGGPIGAAVGAIVGALSGAISGLLGNKTAFTSVDLATGGITRSQNSKKDARNQVISQALGEFLPAVDAIRDAIGASFKQGISIGISENGDRIRAFVEDTFNPGRIIAVGVDRASGDIESAIRDALKLAVGNAFTGGDEVLKGLTLNLLNAQAPLETIADTLATFTSFLKVGEPPLSQYAAQVQELNKAYSEAVSTVSGLTEAEQLLTAARDKAIENLRGEFLAGLQEIEFAASGDLRAGFRQVAQANEQLIQDELALFGTTTQSFAARAANFQQFFTQALEAGASITDIGALFESFAAIATEAGASVEALTAGLEKAKVATREAFNATVAGDISGFLDGPLDQLERLLKEQKKRADEATALGADLSQVQRLTALELRDFFEGLSEQAIKEVQSFLGLFEEAADSVARNLDLSRQDLQSRADSFGRFAQEFADLATDFRERFVAASPRESLSILRGRANELLGEIGQGNESAAQALPQVLNQLVESARQSFGNTRGFQEVLDFALQTLSSAEQSALGVQTEAERQIAALDESNDILSDIRDILQSGQAFNALLGSASSGGVASSEQLLALIQQGAGLTFTANDNAAALNVTGLIAQSVQPIVTPIANSIDAFTARLSDMPQLQRLQIEATDRVADSITDVGDRLEEGLNRLEILEKKILEELEQAA